MEEDRPRARARASDWSGFTGRQQSYRLISRQPKFWPEFSAKMVEASASQHVEAVVEGRMGGRACRTVPGGWRIDKCECALRAHYAPSKKQQE